MRLSVISLLAIFASTVVCDEQAVAEQQQQQVPDQQPEQIEQSEPKIEYPSTMGLKEFDKLTNEKLVLVEFFSPYCHHCKAFAPVWKEAYLKFKENYPDYNIDMRQVNCVESGDLCDREHIDFYPNILLYAPVLDKNGDKTGKSKSIDSFPRGVDRSSENIIKYLQEAYSEYDSGAIGMPSSSKLLDIDSMLRVIDGDIDNPTFVAFFPVSEKEWEIVDNGGKAGFTNQPEVVHAKQIWDRLSNKILSISDTGHFMCKDNPSKLKINKNYPQFVMFLPRSIGVVRFDYDDFVEINRMKKWVTKLFQNSRYEVVSARGITEVMEFTKVLANQPIPYVYPLQSKVLVLFFYDVDNVTPEDEAILPHLLKTLQDSPFNVELHKAKHKKIEENVITMGKNLIDYINYDETEKYQYDQVLSLATTLTSKPTIIILKDNSLIANVYQSFAPEDMRTYDKVEKFIQQSQYPLYGHLTPELAPYYFDKSEANKDDLVVAVFVDLENLKDTDSQLYHLSLIAHEYHYLQQQQYYEQVLKSRQDKFEKAKEQTEALEVLKELREQVPHLWTKNDRVLFTFIDQPKAFKQFRNVKGWKLNPRNYQVGDVVILSKDNTYYWDTDLEGNKLTNQPKNIKKTLLSILNKDNQAHRKIVGSPYGGILSFMDYVHDYGFLGYLGFFITIYLILFALFNARRFRIRKRSSPNSSGILGNFDGAKKD
ncbi:LOW QUALITY PROTEIN: EPS1 ER-retained PMA1-suppressing protein 1 [Candida maltosa Xu316]